MMCERECMWDLWEKGSLTHYISTNTLKEYNTHTPTFREIGKSNTWTETGTHTQDTHLGQHWGGMLPLLAGGVLHQVRLKCVKLGQLVHGEVALDLLLVHHAERQRLLGHLTVVDLLLHGSL